MMGMVSKVNSFDLFLIQNNYEHDSVEHYSVDHYSIKNIIR